jgi:hypothetical protein
MAPPLRQKRPRRASQTTARQARLVPGIFSPAPFTRGRVNGRGFGQDGQIRRWASHFYRGAPYANRAACRARSSGIVSGGRRPHRNSVAMPKSGTIPSTVMRSSLRLIDRTTILRWRRSKLPRKGFMGANGGVFLADFDRARARWLSSLATSRAPMRPSGE